MTPTRLAAWIDAANRDLRHAVRAIVRAPFLSTVIIVSLAAGIGINTIVFSWIQARMLQPLPGVAGSGRFLLVEPRTDAGMYPGTSWPEYRDLAERLRSFQTLIAFRMTPLYVGETGRVERVYGQLVSGNYFAALGLRPALGRLPGAADRAEDSAVVISYGLWQSRYGGAPGALARTVRVNGRELAIAGVAPREFQGTVSGLNFDIWLPAPLASVVLSGSRELDDRSMRGLSILGVLAPSSTREHARRELDAAMQELARTHPQVNAAVAGDVLAFWQSPRGPQRLLTLALGVLQAIMLVLLLAICGNATNLALARVSTRHSEMGIRLTLGASPWRVARLVVLENVLLSLAAAAAGAVIAVWGTGALQLLPLTTVPVRFQTHIDGLGLAVAMALGVVSGSLVALVPAVQLARLDPQLALRAASRTASRSRMRQALMAGQAGLALMVLIAAGLFLQGFLDTRSADPGFRREGVLLAAYDFTGRNTSLASTRTFGERARARLRALPNVEAAAIAASVPLDIHGLPSRAFILEGRARSDGRADQALVNTVTPGYFTVMGIPILAGADFADLGDLSSPPQVIVNDAFVNRYLAGAEPIGRRLQARGGTFVISGVVRKSLYNAFGEPATPSLYFSYRDTQVTLGELHLRTRPGSEHALAADVRRLLRDLDPELPIFNVRTLSDHVESNLIFRRIPARMFAVLGPLLLVLAAIGVYAVVSYTVSLRTSEIGVRVALGATAPRLVAELVGESLGIVVLGALIGWLIAFAVALDLSPTGADATVFIGAPALLLLVAAYASWLPARHATRIDPVMALRQDQR